MTRGPVTCGMDPRDSESRLPDGKRENAPTRSKRDEASERGRIASSNPSGIDGGESSDRFSLSLSLCLCLSGCWESKGESKGVYPNISVSLHLAFSLLPADFAAFRVTLAIALPRAVEMPARPRARDDEEGREEGEAFVFT